MILDYIKRSFRRQLARRVTAEYQARIDHFDLQNEGRIEFANWDNPLCAPVQIRQETVDFFKQFIKPGDLAFDIGANVGDTTVPMALAAGPTGLVLGFDPNPFTNKILAINATLNTNRQHIVALPYAISDREEDLYFISSEASFSNGGISRTKASKHGAFVYPKTIAGIRLKPYLEREYGEWVERLSFIKIDAEGEDRNIIRSIADLIGERKPVLIAESRGRDSDAEKMELYDTIQALGYRIAYCEEFDINAALTDLTDRREMTQWKQTINICAVPLSRAGQ